MFHNFWLIGFSGRVRGRLVTTSTGLSLSLIVTSFLLSPKKILLGYKLASNREGVTIKDRDWAEDECKFIESILITRVNILLSRLEFYLVIIYFMTN